MVYKLDRLTRSVRDLDDLLREFDHRGLSFRSATEQFETATASGRLFLRIVTQVTRVKGPHGALVSRERFDQVQRLFQMRKGMSPRQV